MIKVPNHPGIYYRTNKYGQKIYYLRIKDRRRQTWRAIGVRLQDAKAIWYELKTKRASAGLGIVLPGRMLFRELADEYLAYYQTKARESNWPRVRSVFKHLVDGLGAVDINAVSPWLIAKHIQTRSKAGLAPGTINQELIYLAAALNKAVEWGRLEKAPVIKLLPVQRGRARILSDAELEYVLANVSEPHRDAILIAVDTGMRIREIFMLRPGRVDYESDTIHVEDTKSGKPRSIPMTPRVRDILKRRFAEHSGRLFRERNEIYLSRNFHYDRAKLTGIAPWRFHDLRHTFCTRLLREGVDPFTVMKLSGHSKLEMVTRYLHTDDDLKRDAIGKLNGRGLNRD